MKTLVNLVFLRSQNMVSENKLTFPKKQKQNTDTTYAHWLQKQNINNCLKIIFTVHLCNQFSIY